ncbi:LON peptidase substrate-binding domain-containing protein [Pseudoxanthomonas composti]|uniref:ATP-dependent protease n=1 Tax=Pseudoxanthomonas composti TaxID=2137479 RepID=A0A4Q1K2K1_9GAMM|nr:LON peptidase substrate-binding domain-containing protein [Pseudoxanthomonas composti]RXR08806.1 ATP-dependent protease [Pseudoxanthomonas composti]
MADHDTLPLFPLHTVLLPGAALGLRVFERRYLDLVRDCGRAGTGFGICLILDGQEAGAPAMPAAYGTEAIIEDFDTGEDGLLALRVRGRRRFHVLRTRVRDNGLVVGEIAWAAPDADDELRAEHGLMATVLEKIYEAMGQDAAALPPEQIDNAAWVGWRLAELLPLSDQQRLAVLQEDDVHTRLDRLLSLMD